MIQRARTAVIGLPTPMAGLALGIASLGWSWENFARLDGYGQALGAWLGGGLLVLLAGKFLCHQRLLKQDLAHPVVGSVVPTFAMASMVVSSSLGHVFPVAGDGVWLLAVALHVVFLLSFLYHRSKDFELHHMVPSWFVPPVGIIVADVSFSGNPILVPVAHAALMFGMTAYAIMLPVMIYRLVFCAEVPDAAKPTIAIMAAPASLSLAGYLSVTSAPSPVIIALLFGIAVLMTAIIYLAFFKLLQLPFSPGYAAFTFPMVIGATALFKTANWMEVQGLAANYVQQVRTLAGIELIVATLVVAYVTLQFINNLLIQPRLISANHA
ncbi:TDT family transporter [Vibrio sp. CAU 1672]|uniref:TDT family transporter n=1 Tax=Vibrio sp. CAU 1672 TaxID=3032594 RepID=UPI0023DBBC27|nr:TDT family transporter [Vibrio sp. CAU 1672]MDF2154407.1 TDT family transporter [Vibrio sp. CAU 1672]